jgi:hypothetical protein
MPAFFFDFTLIFQLKTLCQKIDKFHFLTYNITNDLTIGVGSKDEERYMKYLILVLVFLLVFASLGGHNTVSAKVKPRPSSTPRPTATPRPSPTPRPEVTYNWEQGNNPKLLSEGGDFTMAWWSWFRPSTRPANGHSFILLNHSKDKYDWTGRMDASAFSPNGQEPNDLVEFYSSGRLVSFCVYKDVYEIAPRWARGNIIVVQNFGPKLKGGIPIAGVLLFLNEQQFQAWVAKTVR